MESKKINRILVAVSIVLVVAFVVCALYTFFVPFTSFTEIISAISSFFVAGLTIIYVYTTSKQMDFMKQQLEQMQHDQRMREQPVIDVSSPEFVIERPRLFYSPPYNEYSFQTRYFFYINASNISEYPAVFVDVSAQLIVVENDKELYLSAASKRLNIIPSKSVSQQVHIMFSGDSENKVLEALRSDSTYTLPKLKTIISYKSLSGANYVIEHVYYLDHENEDTITNWHTSIVAAPVEEKRALNILRTSKDDAELEKIFDETKARFSQKLFGEEDLKIQMIEIPEEFSFKTVSDKQFKNLMNNHHYGRYIGKSVPICEAEKEE